MGLFRIGKSEREVIHDMEHERRMISIDELHKEIQDFNSKVSTMSEKELLEKICRGLYLIRIKLESL